MSVRKFLFAVFHIIIALPFLTAYSTSEPSIQEMSVAGFGSTRRASIAGDTDQNRVLVGMRGGPGNSSGYMADSMQLVDEGLVAVLYDQREVGLRFGFIHA